MSIESIYEQINNKTARDYPRVSLHELIHQQAKKTPDAIAVLDQAGAQTFAELDRRSEQLANHLAANGIGHGDLVGVCCNRNVCLLYTSPSPRDQRGSRMPSSA